YGPCHCSLREEPKRTILASNQPMSGRRIGAWLLVTLAAAVSAAAQPAVTGTPVKVSRASGPIKIDGDLSDEAWRTAARVQRWYEVQPGHNTGPPVKSLRHLNYDAPALYAAFEFDD